MKASLRRARLGFTLIELLVVIMILATLAGLAISRVDWARRSADTASAAAGITQAHENIQMFRTMKGVYPSQWDSLIDSTTSGIYGKIFNGHGIAPQLQVTNVPAVFGAPTGIVFSMQHAGIASVLDHNPLTSFASDSATIATIRTLNFMATTPLATVVPDSNVDKAIYPTGRPAGVQLVALGLGRGCTTNGLTLSSPPLCTAIDPSTNYGRFIAIFACYENGRRAELKGFVDSTLQLAANQLKNYYEATPQ